MKVKEYMVCVKNIMVNPRYQRPLNEPWVRKIVKNYNESKVNQLILSATPEGKYYVIDGQHTVEATRRVNGDNAHLSAKVFFDLTQEEEADLFYTYNTERKALTSGDKMRARLASGEPIVVSYFDTLDSAGINWSISKKGGDGGAHTISSHATLVKLFGVIGADASKKALIIARESNHYKPAIVGGLMWLVYKVPEIDQKRLIKKLSSISDAEIDRIVITISANLGYSASTVIAPSSSRDVPSAIRANAKSLAAIYNKQSSVNRINIDKI